MVVGFAGHRLSHENIGIKERLKKQIECLIKNGYTTFFDGNKGVFDDLCLDILRELKEKYPRIEIIRVLSSYHFISGNELPKNIDSTVFPELEGVYFKQLITKRNEWIVENSDIIVCHIVNTFRSGAYNMVRYAEKLNKLIIYL